MIDANSFDTLRGLASQVTKSELELRRKLQEVSASLVGVCDGVDVHARSGDVTFWELEPTGDFEHGFFSFNSARGLSVCSRDMHDCLAQADDPTCEATYRVSNLDVVPVEWLRRAIATGKLQELVHDIEAKLNERLADLNDADGLVSRCLSTPTLAIGTAFADVAKQIGYESVLTDWKSAEKEVVTDPPNAIARACSLTESVCKHLLDDLGVALPSDQSIHPLFKTAAKALGLDPTEQAEPELRGLCSGLATVAQNLGALRTKFSIAHGRGPNDAQLAAAHARLSVNAAGNICTFLMEQWQIKKYAASDS